jgi:hypothetical protein
MSGQECKPDKYKIIEINFKDKCIVKLPKKIKTGKFYKIKINDINPNIYSVLIDTKDTVLSRPELKTPSFGDFSLDALTSLTSGFKNIVGLVIENDTNSIFEEKLNLFNRKIKNSESFNNTQNIEIKNLINQFSDKAKRRVDILEKTKADFDKAKMEFYTYRLKMMKLELKDESYNFEKALETFTEIRNSLVLQQKSLKESLTDYESFLAQKNVKTFLEKNKDYKEQAEKIQIVLKTTNTKIDEFQELVSADIIEKLIKSILNFKHENTFESFPIQFRSEQAEVSIQFVPKDSTMGLQTEKIQPFNFPKKSLEYWSVGSSFYYAFNLRNERFSSVATKDANDIKTYNVVQEDNNNNEFGMAATIRYGNQFHENFGAHISFGPGVSIEKNISPRILLGGGFSLGRKHSLAFDFGFIAGYVERKSNSLNLSTNYSELPQTTITKIDFGGYVSLGYLYKF